MTQLQPSYVLLYTRNGCCFLKHKHSEIALEYFKHEIAIRLEIYKQCDSINEHHKDNLENLIANM